MSIDSTTFTPFSSFGTGLAGTNGATATANSSASAGTNGVDTVTKKGASSLYGLTTDDFMTLFLAQLQNQDPTKPVDDAQMLAQLSQMSQIQTLQQVEEALKGSQLAQSSALIGKTVTGLDVDGNTLSGVVTSVVQSNDAGLVLKVGSQFIKPESVTTVTSGS